MIFEDVTNLWARKGNEAPLIAFAGHTDVVPAGDAKGAALAMMVEILAVTLTGSLYSFEAASFLDPEGPPPPGADGALLDQRPVVDLYDGAPLECPAETR